ncbi:nuclear transport factor 2 family protein [Bradyrhizobium sp. Pear76]|nr:nuclear transport factor 2 family protein [Bradyrhizobium oropedii]
MATKNSTIDRAENERDRGVVLDVRTGEQGTLAAWAGCFAEVWDRPRERLDRLLGLLSDDIVLKAPIRPPVSRGKQAARRGFEVALHGMPDLRADIQRWRGAGDTLFIELTFRATIGGHAIAWNNVDRITFSGGIAVERVAFFDPTIVRRAFFRNFAAFRQLRRMRTAGREGR